MDVLECLDGFEPGEYGARHVGVETERVGGVPAQLRRGHAIEPERIKLVRICSLLPCLEI